MYRQTDPNASYIRVLHASPNSPNVDVYANGNLIAGNLRYREFTPYLKVTPGLYNITIYPAGTTATPVLSTQATINPAAIYTVAAIGRSPNLEIFPVREPRTALSPGHANVRFVHLSPNAPAVDITTPDGKAIFRNIAYKGITEYVPLRPGRHNLEARAAGTNNVVLNVPNIVLRPQRNYTLYAIGLAGEKPGLQLLIPLDGSTYLRT